MIEPTTPLFQDLRCPQTDAIIIWTREPGLVFTQEHLLVHQQSSQGADWVKRHPQPAKGHRPKTGRLGSETEAMTFQFLSGWRVPHSASDSPEQMKMMPVDSAQAPTSICCVERACAAFHTAQDSIVALTEGRDEIDITDCEQHLARRDWAFKQVRAHVARTRSAWQAKVRVLIVMRDWFDAENPDLTAFAIEVALEAAALFDPGQECACRTQGETFEHQSRGAERRNPLAWFVRPWGNATDTPFAN
jgi:hypothetical protein